MLGICLIIFLETNGTKLDGAFGRIMHFTDEGDVGNAACEALGCSVLSFLQCQRHALAVETVSFF